MGSVKFDVPANSRRRWSPGQRHGPHGCRVPTLTSFGGGHPVGFEGTGDRLRPAEEVGRPDGFVRLLGILCLGLVVAGMFGQVALAEIGGSCPARQVRIPRYLDNRPISKLKNFAESTSRATLALGTNLSRNTGDVLTLTSVGADPRIDMFMAAVCFSISERRRKSPALGL